MGIENDNRKIHKIRTGVVVSDRQDKTVVVRVDRHTTHRKYGKIIVKSSKFHVHDEQNAAKRGMKVRIMETRPLSKLKRWRLTEILN